MELGRSLMLQLKTVILQESKRPWHSIAPYSPNALDYYLSLDDTPIGRCWRDYEDLPWNYAVAGALDGRNGFYSWTLPKVLEALWVWRCADWEGDREWRKEYRLPPDPSLDRWLALKFDFGMLAKVGKSSAVEWQQINLLAG